MVGTALAVTVVGVIGVFVRTKCTGNNSYAFVRCKIAIKEETL